MVAVSGGMDSMFLAWAMGRLLRARRLPPPTWIHVNHGTRRACAREEAEVLRWAEKCGDEVKVFHLSKLGTSNFEARARRARQDCFRKALKDLNAQTLYLGHTIDDSFEWYLRQQFRSSECPATPGIPLVHGYIKRPLHCMSRKQIEEVVRFLEIPFCHDESNDNLHFERNFIRHTLVSKIAGRYPSYLKHYVARANQMAVRQSRSAFAVDPRPQRFYDSLGGMCLLQTKGEGHFNGQDALLKQTLVAVSVEGRGQIRRQIQKLIIAQAQGKWGPMYLSGGVRVFMGPGSLLALSTSQLNDYRRWDERAANYVRDALEAQIPELLWNPKHWQLGLQHLVAPFWVLGKMPLAERFLPPLKRPHPLFPQLFASCQKYGLWIRPLGQVLLCARTQQVDPQDFGLAPLVMFGKRPRVVYTQA